MSAPALPLPRRLPLASGVTLSVHERGEGLPVVFCHGFPELAYSWRHQVAAISDAGFRAIAPDMRGYGASERPEPVEAYDLRALTADMVALLDALELPKAVFVGHDWGGFVAWAMPALHPERTAGVIGVNTPYVAFPSTQLLRMLAGGRDERIYVLWFQQPGVAEGVLDGQVRTLFEKLMRGGIPPTDAMARAQTADGFDANPFRRLPEFDAPGHRILTPEELEVYVEAFEKTGFRGGINWYRNIDRNREDYPQVGTAKLSLPCLMVSAEWDPALPPALASGMPNLCSDLESHVIEKCGHWTQQERPDELNQLIIDWLKRRKGDLA